MLLAFNTLFRVPFIMIASPSWLVDTKLWHFKRRYQLFLCLRPNGNVFNWSSHRCFDFRD